MGLELYYLAYVELMSARVLGFGGEGPIPWTAIHMWGCDAELDDVQMSDLIYFVSVLDIAYIGFQTEKRKREHGNGKPGGVRPTHA
jgi:hypothetical protein